MPAPIEILLLSIVTLSIIDIIFRSCVDWVITVTFVVANTAVSCPPVAVPKADT